MIPVAKNKTYTAVITDLNGEGEGIGRVEGFTVFIPGALPEEEVTFLCIKVAKNYAIGKLMSIGKPSPHRVKSPCPYAVKCGGCAYMALDYPAQLAIKRSGVENVLRRIGGTDVEVLPPLGMEDPTHYRNKAQFPAGAEGLGFFARRSHRVIPVENCLIQHPRINDVLAAVDRWAKACNVPVYDEVTGKGLLRHAMARVAPASGQVMAVAVSAGPLPHTEELVARLRSEVPGLVSVIENRNSARTNAVLGQHNRTLWGADYLTEELMGLTFRLSPNSFFQVNAKQTEVLYGKALEFAELDENTLAVDAYCGTGTIALLAAKKAGRVIGIESCAPAVEDAKKNAAANGVTNAEFILAPAEEALPQLVQQGLRPDVVIVDPPRKGCDEKLMDTLVACAPKRIVYVSCNPATLARDIARLAPHYRPETVQPVDMFPFTGHIENVAKLTRTTP